MAAVLALPPGLAALLPPLPTGWTVHAHGAPASVAVPASAAADGGHAHAGAGGGGAVDEYEGLSFRQVSGCVVRCVVHVVGQKRGVDCCGRGVFLSKNALNPPHTTPHPPFPQHMAAGAAAGIAEHVAMFPVDTVKTRMQALGHPGQALRGAGVARALRAVVRREGVRGLYGGVGAVALGAG